MLNEHKTVLLNEAVEFWHAKPGGFYVDATLGLGGHSEALLSADPLASILGLDVDSEAIEIARSRLAKFGSRIHILKEGFMNLGSAIEKTLFKRADGILADLGVSSIQLDRADRGFSFQKSGPLDMRMDPSSGETARDLIHRCTEEELAEILRDLGEERLNRP